MVLGAGAAEWYRRAAQQGDASAQNNLGALYARGEGVGRDDMLAVYWYGHAAEQNYALAQVNLAGMYAAGRGVECDLVLACMWLWLAARAGWSGAPRADGKPGTPAGKHASMHQVEQAMAHAVEQAAARMRQLAAALAPAERLRARELAGRWLAAREGRADAYPGLLGSMGAA